VVGAASVSAFVAAFCLFDRRASRSASCSVEVNLPGSEGISYPRQGSEVDNIKYTVETDVKLRRENCCVRNGLCLQQMALYTQAHCFFQSFILTSQTFA